LHYFSVLCAPSLNSFHPSSSNCPNKTMLSVEALLLCPFPPLSSHLTGQKIFYSASLTLTQNSACNYVFICFNLNFWKCVVEMGCHPHK
jgi:hypothetical protein